MGRENIFLKPANFLAYVGVLAANYLASPLSPRGGEDGKESDSNDFLKGNVSDWDTLLTPASYVNYIWFVIYGLLAGFVLYQWFRTANDVVVDGIQWYHVLASVMNIGWFLAWQNENLHILNALLAIGLTFSLSRIYDRLGEFPPKNIFERFFIHWAFSIYVAYAGVATILTFWTAFPEFNTTLYTTIAVVIIGLTGIYVVDYSSRKDAVFATTIVWVLVGVAYEHHDDKSILIASAVMSGLIFGGIARSCVLWIQECIYSRGPHPGETTPLLNA